MKIKPETLPALVFEKKIDHTFMPHFSAIPFCFILCIWLFQGNSHAQGYEDLYLLYSNHRIEQLASRLKEYEKRSPSAPEIQFFNAVFMENGDEAMAVYQDLFGKSSGRLKNLIAAKISAYYFAQGYYVKADDYNKLAATKFPLKAQENLISSDNRGKDNANKVEDSAPQEESVKPVYIIQVGAFGVEQNADDLSTVLQKRKVNTRVVKRRVGDNDLFCVWIDGAEDYAATKEMAEEIREKFKLSYRILKP